MINGKQITPALPTGEYTLLEFANATLIQSGAIKNTLSLVIIYTQDINFRQRYFLVETSGYYF
jgi:hypothetical protein